MLAFFVNSIHDPEYNTGTKLEDDYFQIGKISKRYFSVDTAKVFARGFDIKLLDDQGETYKDRAIGVHNLVRFVGVKPIGAPHTMHVPPIAETLLAANRRRYAAAQNPLKSHGPDHHWRVYQYSLQLANKLQAEYDPDILAGAALLHDMAAYYPEQTGENYHDHDHAIAEEVLREINFPNEKIPAVLDAIANHGSDPKYKQADERIETTILRDADKLDVFGPVGVARIIMVRTLKGDTLDDIVADFYTGGHLKRKWESVTTDEARAIAKDDYAYSVAFFERLSRDLDGGSNNCVRLAARLQQ